MLVESVPGQLLIQAAQEIFETMVFMSIEASDQGAVQTADDSLLGTISFVGDIEGCFDFRCEKGCAKAVAAGMLGLESGDELTDEDTHDATGEIVNMIMGSIKAAGGTFGQLQISVPTVFVGKGVTHRVGEYATHAMSTQVLIAEKYPAELSLLWRERTGV